MNVSVVIGMAAYLISFVFIGYMTYLAMPGSSLFSWHPFLMTLGVVGFMFQSIMVFSKESSLFISLSHKTKVNIHWVLNTLGAICILIGYACIYINKEQNSKSHLVSWHGLIGLLVVLYSVTQWMAGHMLTLFIDKIRHIIPYSKLQFYHSFSGLVLYLSATIVLIMGLFTNWFKSKINNSGFIQYLCAVCLLLLILMVVNQLTTKYVVRRLKAQPAK